MHKRLLLLFFSACLPQAALARDHILIESAPGAFPSLVAAAERFHEEGNALPLVISTSSAKSLVAFCNGLGDDKPDIIGATRRISDDEQRKCESAGIKDVTEILLGHDAAVLVQKKGATDFALTSKQLFLALARLLPSEKGVIKANPYKTWQQVDPALPDVPIALYGPPESSGMRSAFVTSLMGKGCEQVEAFIKAFPDAVTRNKACHSMRDDKKYFGEGEDDESVGRKIVADEKLVGIVSYDYYDQNRDILQAIPLDGVKPSAESIIDGTYPAARTLYAYAKPQRIGKIPGLEQFIQGLAGEAARKSGAAE